MLFRDSVVDPHRRVGRPHNQFSPQESVSPRIDHHDARRVRPLDRCGSSSGVADGHDGDEAELVLRQPGEASQARPGQMSQCCREAASPSAVSASQSASWTIPSACSHEGAGDLI